MYIKIFVLILRYLSGFASRNTNVALKKAIVHHQTQYCLLFMLEKGKSAVVKGKYLGVLLADLSKALLSFSRTFSFKITSAWF